MSVSSIALSGMNAASVSMNSAARNIANLATGDLAREQPEPTVMDGGSPVPFGVGTNGREPIEDMVGLLQSKNAFLANLTVFKTADAMTGALLNVTQ